MNSTVSKTPVCALYLFYYATQQALESTALQRSLKMIKTSPNNNCMSVCAEFSQFPGAEEAKL